VESEPLRFFKIQLQEVNEKYPDMISEEELSKAMNEENGPQVYAVADEDALIRACITSYQNTCNTACLAVALDFFLGLRIVELAALKVTDFDIDKGIVHIHRREITSRMAQDWINAKPLKKLIFQRFLTT